ncbi:MAG: tetratricopeptide repeat protein [Thermodesulfobacteriota bacterium]
MKVKKKITKKKLKEPDQFLNLTQKAFLFITHHLKKIVAGGITVFVVLLAIFFFQRWEERKEEDAYRKLSLAVEIYQMVSSPYRERSSSDYKNILEKFDEVIHLFPRTSSGKISFLYKGNIQLQLGEFEEAIKAYQTFLQKAGKEKLYRLFAMEGLGYAHEGKKDYEKALSAYQKIVKEGESFQSAGAYLNMGRCYEKLGKNKEALENYKSFLKLAQKSQMTNAVLRKISILEKEL